MRRNNDSPIAFDLRLLIPIHVRLIALIEEVQAVRHFGLGRMSLGLGTRISNGFHLFLSGNSKRVLKGCLWLHKSLLTDTLLVMRLADFFSSQFHQRFEALESQATHVKTVVTPGCLLLMLFCVS